MAPAVLIVTSGTAVANLLPGVVEAWEAGVPRPAPGLATFQSCWVNPSPVKTQPQLRANPIFQQRVDIFHSSFFRRFFIYNKTKTKVMMMRASNFEKVLAEPCIQNLHPFSSDMDSKSLFVRGLEPLIQKFRSSSLPGIVHHLSGLIVVTP